MNPNAWTKFEVTVPGKWLLTGEHSVIRGATAIAMPHPKFTLSLRFDPETDPTLPLQVNPPSILPIVEDAFRAAKLSEPTSGKLEIESTIPVGAGMGSSAALCVALTRWIGEKIKLTPEEWPAFATALENRFHGKSSGVDVAVVCAQEPLSFVRGQKVKALGLRSIPHFTFHDTGLRANTHDCVSQVETYLGRNPERGGLSDERMAKASLLAIDGLREFDRGEENKGLTMLSKAMNLAHESFLEWNLVPSEAAIARDKLLHEGALAVKLTGAGGGGMLLALWAKPL